MNSCIIVFHEHILVCLDVSYVFIPRCTSFYVSLCRLREKLEDIKEQPIPWREEREETDKKQQQQDEL